MPVRKVSNRGGNAIGRFPSTKMGRMIAFESLLERDFIYLLDYDPAVEWFEEQPLSIEYLHEGKQLHYTPDFHLLEDGQHVLVECKPERFVEAEENRRKFGVAQEWCQARLGLWAYLCSGERFFSSLGFRVGGGWFTPAGADLRSYPLFSPPGSGAACGSACPRIEPVSVSLRPQSHYL